MVYCQKRFQTKNQRFWDLKHADKVYHPHYEPVKSKPKCLEHRMKDGDYIYEGTHKDAPFTPEVYLQSNKSKQGYGFTYLASQIKSGRTIDDFNDVINHL